MLSRMQKRSIACGLLLSLFVALGAHASSSRVIGEVSIAPSFFNPTTGQHVTVRFNAAVSGTLRLTILDRDRFPIRSLAPTTVKPGPVSMTWDGRDDQAAIVPDEAWNIRIELGGQVYDPSLDFMPISEDPQPRSYSAMSGVLSYRLSRPSRVHIEAGQARLNGGQRSREGPILKTIADREPRVGGSVIERWDGFDESGTIRVTDLPDFVVSVLATSLPEGSIITRGNHRQGFLAYARQRRPKSALEAREHAAPTHHHVGLNAFEDHSPTLEVNRTWTKAGALELEVRVTGPNKDHFLKQPGEATIYVDDRRVLLRRKPSHPLTFSIPAKELARGERVVVNWDSEFGPGGTASFLLNAPSKASARSEVGR